MSGYLIPNTFNPNSFIEFLHGSGSPRPGLQHFSLQKNGFNLHKPVLMLSASKLRGDQRGFRGQEKAGKAGKHEWDKCMKSSHGAQQDNGADRGTGNTGIDGCHTADHHQPGIQGRNVKYDHLPKTGPQEE